MNVTLEQAAEVLDDARVVRAVRAAHRDRALCDEYESWRRGGLTQEAAAHETARAYAVSPERVLSIVYRKKRRRSRRDGR